MLESAYVWFALLYLLMEVHPTQLDFDTEVVNGSKNGENWRIWERVIVVGGGWLDLVENNLCCCPTMKWSDLVIELSYLLLAVLYSKNFLKSFDIISFDNCQKRIRDKE